MEEEDEMEMSPNDYAGPIHQCAGEGCIGEEHKLGVPVTQVIKGVGVSEGQELVEFVIKDSGVRESYSGGMVRDTAKDKTDYTFCTQGPMLKRWAEHLMKGAIKYERDNWMKAEGEAELKRFQQSALRHLIQYLRGETDEDHAAAVFFNLNGAEYVKGKMEGR